MIKMNQTCTELFLQGHYDGFNDAFKNMDLLDYKRICICVCFPFAVVHRLRNCILVEQEKCFEVNNKEFLIGFFSSFHAFCSWWLKKKRKRTSVCVSAVEHTKRGKSSTPIELAVVQSRPLNSKNWVIEHTHPQILGWNWVGPSGSLGLMIYRARDKM